VSIRQQSIEVSIGKKKKREKKKKPEKTRHRFRTRSPGGKKTEKKKKKKKGAKPFLFGANCHPCFAFRIGKKEEVKEPSR